jgi:hypothetical protein
MKLPILLRITKASLEMCWKVTVSNLIYLVADNAAVNSAWQIPMIGCASHRFNLACKKYLESNEVFLQKIQSLMINLSQVKQVRKLRTKSALEPIIPNPIAIILSEPLIAIILSEPLIAIILSEPLRVYHINSPFWQFLAAGIDHRSVVPPKTSPTINNSWGLLNQLLPKYQINQNDHSHISLYNSGFQFVFVVDERFLPTKRAENDLDF